jgi:hypothetical protein
MGGHGWHARILGNIVAKNEFSMYWKHQHSSAQDVNFECIADAESCVVEVIPSPNNFDSNLLIALALNTFPDHGIDAVARKSESMLIANTTPPWKIILRLSGLRFNVEIIELSNLQNTQEKFTVLLGLL